MTTDTTALNTLALDLVRAAAQLTRAANRLPGVAYSSIAWRVLADLERDGAERVSALAVSQRVAQPTMTALVQRLEGEGWIERTPDPADGRAALIGITAAGSDALQAYRVSAAALIAPRLASLDPRDREVLARAAELVRTIAGAA